MSEGLSDFKRLVPCEVGMSPRQYRKSLSDFFTKDNQSTLNSKEKNDSSDEASKNQSSEDHEILGILPSTSGISYVNEQRHREKGSRRLEFHSNFDNFPNDSEDAITSLPNGKFDEPTIVHHSFVAELPDVVHMERSLLVLLDEFTSGKLKAFGASNTMEQMIKIREQQENLAKLHFELATPNEDSSSGFETEENTVKADGKIASLLGKLEELSLSVETLQCGHAEDFHCSE